MDSRLGGFILHPGLTMSVFEVSFSTSDLSPPVSYRYGPKYENELKTCFRGAAPGPFGPRFAGIDHM